MIGESIDTPTGSNMFAISDVDGKIVVLIGFGKIAGPLTGNWITTGAGSARML